MTKPRTRAVTGPLHRKGVATGAIFTEVIPPKQEIATTMQHTQRLAGTTPPQAALLPTQSPQFCKSAIIASLFLAADATDEQIMAALAALLKQLAPAPPAPPPAALAALSHRAQLAARRADRGSR